MRFNKSKPAVFYMLSFFIPAIIILAALAGLKVTPFGDNSLVISDGNALYINYMGYVSRALKGQEGILFSFEKGLGGNMTGSWGWFLLNPFFALFAFVDVTNYMQMYTIVSMLNFCVCGLTMYILLKDIYGHRLSNLIFSTAYALNGFLVANVFQMNFFSVIPVLPIMVMGLRRILNDKNPIIYIISIAYSLLTNFYFGYMLCVASLLIFIVFFVANRNELKSRKSVAVKYIISSFLGGLLSSVVWLPGLLSLRGGRLDQDITGFLTMRENMPFLSMFAKLFTGANTTGELKNGLPNIFVGILAVFLVILFFINKKIPKKNKIVTAVLLIFYLVSFYACVFNLVMHGGTATNWFNYRDSFVFCFIMLMIAAEEWHYITDEPWENLKKAAAILIVSTIIVFSRVYDFVTGGAVLIDFVILGLIFLAYWMHKKDPEKNPKRIFSMVVLVLVCVNLFLNYSFSTKNIMVWTNKESDYQKVVIPVSAIVESVQKSDNDFYRMEIGEQRSGNCGNDPMLYGYYGVGHGGSDDRDFVRLKLSELGVLRFNMRNNYGRGITEATDTLLGLKYIVSKENLAIEKGYEKLLELGEWTLYRNSDALPIAFVADSEIDDVVTDLEDIFQNLNQTWSGMTGMNEQIFIEEEDVSFSSHNIIEPYTLTGKEAARIIGSQNNSQSISESESQSKEIDPSGSAENGNSDTASLGYATQGTFETKPKNTHYIVFTWTASRDGAYYSYNRSGMTEDNGAAPPALNFEGYHHKGDIVTRYLPVTGTFVSENLLEEVAGRFKVASVDEDALAKMSHTILNRPSAIEKIKDSHLSGTFKTESGQQLMFTIPYDEGWTLTVDGKETELKKVLGVFMAADVEPGKHTYEMKFVPTGLKAGAAAAGISLLLTILFVILDRKKRKNKENNTANTCDEGDYARISQEKSAVPNLKYSSEEQPMKPNELGNGPKQNRGTIKDFYHNLIKAGDRSVYSASSDKETHTWIILILLTVVSILICMKSSYNPFAPFQQNTDPSVFEYVGTVMSKGGVMYKDTFDHKGPLLYFLNWLGVVIGGGIWFIELAFILTSLIGCYSSFRLFFNNKILSAFGAAIVLLPMYTYFENGNTVEEYALPFIIWGLYIFIRYFHEQKISNIAIGACGFFLGCVLLLRINMIAMWVVFAIAVIVSERKNIKTLLGYASLFIAGMLLSFIPFFIYLAANHAFDEFIKQYIFFNFKYAEVDLTVRFISTIRILLHYSSLPVIVLSILLLLVKPDKKILCITNLIYHLVNVVFLCISGYTFTHYYIVLIPAYLLTIILLFNYLEVIVSVKRLTIVAVIFALSLSIPWLRFIWVDLPRNHEIYNKGIVAVANVIKENTQPSDKIIVCGNQDVYYLLSDRTAASKYSYQLPIAERDPSIYEDFLRDIQENEPEVFVLNAGPSILDFKNLNLLIVNYLSSHHYEVWLDGDVKVLGKQPLILQEK